MSEAAVSRRSRHVASNDISLSAVEQRVFTTEQGLSQLGTQMDSRMNAMAESINRRIDRLSQAIEDKSTPQYQTMFAGMGVLLTILGMVGTIVYVLIQTQINAGAQQAVAVAASVERVADMVRQDYVPRIELDGRREDDRVLAKLIDDDNKERSGRLSVDLAGLRQNTITLSDHTALTDRVSRVETLFGSTYSIGDVLKDIQNRLSAIERGTAMRAATAPVEALGGR